MHMLSMNIDVPHDPSKWDPHPSSWGAAGYCVLFLKRAYILGGVNLEDPQSHLFPERCTFLPCGPRVRIPELETWKGWKGLARDSRA